jgi:hypothetical protein
MLFKTLKITTNYDVMTLTRKINNVDWNCYE